MLKFTKTSFAVLSGMMLLAVDVFAQTEGGHGGADSWVGWALPVAIALGIGIVGMAGAFGQSRTASAALEGIARNPQASDKLFVPMILGLAFIESLVLFTWVLMLLMQLKM